MTAARRAKSIEDTARPLGTTAGRETRDTRSTDRDVHDQPQGAGADAVGGYELSKRPLPPAAPHAEGSTNGMLSGTSGNKTGWPADQIERRRPQDLVPYATNARTHTKAQIAQLAASIREWGWTNPILIDDAGMVIAGHGRVLAALELQLADVPVAVASGWSDAQKRAYVLADNQLALNAGWDMALLRSELEGLREWGFDVELIGFDAPDEQSEHWDGMPEFALEDKRAHRSLHCHFKDQAALDEFAQLVGKTITEKTRTLWFPDEPDEVLLDKRYETDA